MEIAFDDGFLDDAYRARKSEYQYTNLTMIAVPEKEKV